MNRALHGNECRWKRGMTVLFCLGMKCAVQVEEATNDGRVMFKLIKKGKSYRNPNEGATVKVAYTAQVGGPNGPVVEEVSREHPLTFAVDQGAPGKYANAIHHGESVISWPGQTSKLLVVD